MTFLFGLTWFIYSTGEALFGFSFVDSVSTGIIPVHFVSNTYCYLLYNLSQ